MGNQSFNNSYSNQRNNNTNSNIRNRNISWVNNGSSNVTHNEWYQNTNSTSKPQKGTNEEWGKPSCWNKDYGQQSICQPNSWGSPNSWVQNNQINNWSNQSQWQSNPQPQQLNWGHNWSNQPKLSNSSNSWGNFSRNNQWLQQSVYNNQPVNSSKPPQNNQEKAPLQPNQPSKTKGENQKTQGTKSGENFNERQCKLCFNAESTMMNRACRHLMMCKQCFFDYNKKYYGSMRVPCPLCNTLGDYVEYIAPIFS